MRQSNIQPVSKLDPFWTRIRTEAEEITRSDPALGGFVFAAVLNHTSFEKALIHRLAQRLGNAQLVDPAARLQFARKNTLPHQFGNFFVQSAGGEGQGRHGRVMGRAAASGECVSDAEL